MRGSGLHLDQNGPLPNLPGLARAAVELFSSAKATRPRLPATAGAIRVNRPGCNPRWPLWTSPRGTTRPCSGKARPVGNESRRHLPCAGSCRNLDRQRARSSAHLGRI